MFIQLHLTSGVSSPFDIVSKAVLHPKQSFSCCFMKTTGSEILFTLGSAVCELPSRLRRLFLHHDFILRLCHPLSWNTDSLFALCFLSFRSHSGGHLIFITELQCAECGMGMYRKCFLPTDSVAEQELSCDGLQKQI